MHKNLSTIVTTILVIATLASCSGTGLGDMFSGYTQQMNAARNAQKMGKFSEAESKIAVRSPSDGTYALNKLEFGRLQFLSNNWEKSKKSFETAYKQVQIEDQKANIQVTRGFEKVGAVVSNDNALRYDVPYYEQSMLHTYQALNYVYQRDLEGALVEVRRANLVQERALKANQTEILEAQSKMQDYGVSQDVFNKSYPSMDDIIGQVKNGFQNAYTFYLSGVLYEAFGEPNDAYIDYKKALEIYPDNFYLQQDVLRLAKKLSMSDDLAKFENLYGAYNSVEKAEHGRVVVIYEQGIVQPKTEARFSIPIYRRRGHSRIYNFAMPVYRNGQTSTIPLRLNYDGNELEAEQIVRLQSLAAKQLEDQLPATFVRQIVRLLAKEEIRKEMAYEGGDWGNLVANLYNAASENADTRSWSTLPDSVHILPIDLPTGEQEFTLTVGMKKHPITVMVKPNKITLVNVTAIGGYSDYQTTNL